MTGKFMENEIALLIEQLTDTTLSYAAEEQLLALGAAAVQPLIDSMNDGPDKISWRVAGVLLKINDDRIFPALVEGLSSANILVRQIIAQGFGKLGDIRAVPVLIDGLSDDGAPIVQLSVVTALGMLADKRAVDPLVTILLNTEFAALRHTIIKVLGEIGDDSLIEIFRQFEHDENHHVRNRVRDALQSMANNSD